MGSGRGSSGARRGRRRGPRRRRGHRRLACDEGTEGRYARVPDRVVYATSGNLPGFAAGSPSAYFEAADLYERANGRLFKEVEFALPIELELDEQRELAERFAVELLAGEALPYTLAIQFNADAIAYAIRTASPRIDERKRGHVQDYAERTAESALRAHSRALQRDRGWERGVRLRPQGRAPDDDARRRSL